MCEYRDWFSDEDLYKEVMDSIKSIDEKEVEKYIENARKVLLSINYRPEYDIWEVHEYLDYIECINKNMRYGTPDGCMSVLAMDILENRQLWTPYKFGFKECLENVAKEIDNVFLNYDDSVWSNYEEYEFDDDEYYLD